MDNLLYAITKRGLLWLKTEFMHIAECQRMMAL